MTVRDVYVGTGAYLGRVDSETQCAFWPTDPNKLTKPFDPGQLIAIDLAMTAEAAAAGKITYDDVHTETGKLTFGPRWPLGPNQVGRVYLREPLVSPKQPPNPPLGGSGHDYEYKLIIYRANTGDARAGRRYQGVHVDIIGASQTPKAGTEIDLYGPGVSKTGQKKRITIDLHGLDACPPPTGTVEATATRSGALFITDTLVYAIWPSWPKLPPSAGL